MSDLQLSFHGTFALKKEDLIKIIQAAAEEKGLDDNIESLMQRTGLGNRKVGPMKSWASRAGLVSNNGLSPEGEIVWRKDPRLVSNVTEWLMHFYLSLGDRGLIQPPDAPAEWGGWSYFVYSFLPQYSTFTMADLLQNSASIFEKDFEKTQETSKNLTKNFRIVLRAYTEPEAIAACRFVQTLDKNQFVTGDASIPNPYMVGYLLAKLWERDFDSQTSVLTEDILNHKMGLASILGIGAKELQEQLNTLEAYAIIEQRRTVAPFQIVRRWDSPLALLEKAYAFE